VAAEEIQPASTPAFTICCRSPHGHLRELKYSSAARRPGSKISQVWPANLSKRHCGCEPLPFPKRRNSQRRGEQPKHAQDQKRSRRRLNNWVVLGNTAATSSGEALPALEKYPAFVLSKKSMLSLMRYSLRTSLERLSGGTRLVNGLSASLFERFARRRGLELSFVEKQRALFRTHTGDGAQGSCTIHFTYGQARNLPEFRNAFRNSGPKLKTLELLFIRRSPRRAAGLTKSSACYWHVLRRGVSAWRSSLQSYNLR